MSAEVVNERRRSARAVPAMDVECCLELSTRVKLVDISLSGVLLDAELPLPVGTLAGLRSTLGPGSFRADVKVARIAGSPAPASKGLGAVFTVMDERSRRSLEEFLRKAMQ
jgi:hypothetical protein